MSDFTSLCYEQGLLVMAPVPDGRVHRVPTAEKPRKRNGVYRWNGDWGWVCNWNRVPPGVQGAAIVWRADTGSAAAATRAAYAPDRAAILANEREERARAAHRAQTVLRRAGFDRHAYLERKGFSGLQWLVDTDGRLVVPMRHFATRALQSVQWIAEDGAKKFLPGGAAQDAVHAIGPTTASETWLAEGLATALSVQAGLRVLHRPARVLVCFSAGTLARVGAALKGRVFVAADHDYPNPMTGKRAGYEAAVAAGKPYFLPPHEGDDANDVHQREGLDSLVDLMRSAM